MMASAHAPANGPPRAKSGAPRTGFACASPYTHDGDNTEAYSSWFIQKLQPMPFSDRRGRSGPIAGQIYAQQYFMARTGSASAQRSADIARSGRWSEDRTSTRMNYSQTSTTGMPDTA